MRAYNRFDLTLRYITMVINEVEPDRDTILTVAVSASVVEDHLLGNMRDIKMQIIVHVLGAVMDGELSAKEWIAIFVRAFDLEPAGNGRG